MRGKFYGVGVGPGDPELITMKAAKILKECSCVVVPKSMGSSESTAYSIASEYINSYCEVIEIGFKMSRTKEERQLSRTKAAEKIAEILDKDLNTAFITLGDPTIYSTCMYVYQILSEKGYECEIVPGVTSFCGAAARLGISIAEEDESFAVISNSGDKEEVENAINEFDNVVLMKTAKNVGVIKSLLKEKERNSRAFTVTRCGLEGEKVYNSLDEISDGELSYFTTMIVKK